MNRASVALAAALAGTALLSSACSSHTATPAPAPSLLPSSSDSSAPSPSPSPSPSPTTAAASPSPSPSPTAAALAFCRSATLRLSLGVTHGGAGQFHQPLILTNTGAPCTLRGYPGVSFLDAAGRQLGSPAEQTPAPAQRILLATGGAASAGLTYSNAGAYPDSTCRATEAAQVRVYPPGERVALTVPDKVLVCAAPGSHQLHIEPMVAGSG